MFVLARVKKYDQFQLNLNILKPCYYGTRFFFKNKLYKQIRLEVQKIKNMLRTFEGFADFKT